MSGRPSAGRQPSLHPRAGRWRLPASPGPTARETTVDPRRAQTRRDCIRFSQSCLWTDPKHGRVRQRGVPVQSDRSRPGRRAPEEEVDPRRRRADHRAGFVNSRALGLDARAALRNARGARRNRSPRRARVYEARERRPFSYTGGINAAAYDPARSRPRACRAASAMDGGASMDWEVRALVLAVCGRCGVAAGRPQAVPAIRGGTLSSRRFSPITPLEPERFRGSR
jgi:hypothetical protein